MKLKNVHPLLGTGIVALFFLVITSLIGLATGSYLLSESKFLVGLVVVILVISCFPGFAKKYDPKDNDNIKAAIFLISLVILFLLIVFFFYR